MPIMVPSFGPFTTTSVPSAPPAPGRLIGTTGTLSSLASASPMARAAVSVASPAASGMTRLIGPDGYCWATAGTATAKSAHSIAARRSVRITASSFVFTGSADDERAVLALALGHAAGFHPLIGPGEELRVVVIHVLVMHEGAQELFRLQRALRVRGDVMRVLVEVRVDQVYRLVLGVVIGLALLRR